MGGVNAFLNGTPIRFSEALSFTAELHATQIRKGAGIPYISHLMAASSIALEHGASEDEAIAALLHDAVEDQGGQPTPCRKSEARRYHDLCGHENVAGQCTGESPEDRRMVCATQIHRDGPPDDGQY